MTTTLTTPATALAPIDITTTADFCLPDIPERHPDDMTSFYSLHRTGISPSLARYLSNRDTTIVSAEHYIVPGETYVAGESRAPDLMVVFDADPEAYDARNGYVVPEQGKPPDFILEVASRSSRHGDREEKKAYYETMGVQEYWLFDRTGQFYGFHLAGFRLVQGQYQEIQLAESNDGTIQGFSSVLNLFLRWRDSELELFDPDGNQISETVRADTAEARADTAEARAAAELSRADQEAARADDAEARADAEASRADQAEVRADDAAALAEAERQHAAAANARAAAADLRAEAEAARARELAAELERLRNG